MPAINPLLPIPILLIVFGLAFLLIFRSYKKLDKGQEARASLLTLRVISMAILFIVALRPRMEFAEERIQKDRIYFLTDVSESMTIKDMPNNKNRRNFADQLLEKHKSELNKLKEKYDIKNFTFARDLTKNSKLKGSNKSTAMGTALYKTAVDSKIRKVKAVILMSDGLNNSGTSINRAVSELKRRKIPVHTLTIGQNSYQGNIVDGIIQELDCPQSMKKDQEMPVTVRGIVRGLQNQTVKLEIAIDNKLIKTIDLKINQQEQSFFEQVNLNIQEQKDGYRKITARIITNSKEISPANNLMNNYVHIKEGGLKLLLLATAPSPEFKFLNRILSSFDNVSPTVPNPFLCRTADGQQYLKDLDIKEFDVVIMQNPNIELLPVELLQKIGSQMKTKEQGLLITGESFIKSINRVLLCKFMSDRQTPSTVPKSPA